MKENLIMTPENHQAFERSIDMLDSSIKEMRRVAHNMMPESLIRFGLDPALKDFCTNITQSGALSITYQSINMENTKLSQTTSITIYRIVQELINNTIKHGMARTAIVQLTRNAENLAVTVEDDGVGFDTSILEKSRGAGWSNIQSRVEFLRGTLEVRSDQMHGTSVHIDLKV
jgi:signal transduction histidine kinase